MRYLTVTSRISFFADLGLAALREGANIAALRHSVGHSQARVRACCAQAGKMSAHLPLIPALDCIGNPHRSITAPPYEGVCVCVCARARV